MSKGKDNCIFPLENQGLHLLFFPLFLYFHPLIKLKPYLVSHRSFCLTILLLMSCFLKAQITPVMRGHQRFDHQLSSRELDSVNAQGYIPTRIRMQEPQMPAAPKRDSRPAAQPVSGLRELIYRTNSICYDTSSRFYLDNDSLRYFVNNPVRTRDGKLLLSGEYFGKQNWIGGGFLIKCDDDGNIIWNHLYDSASAVDFDYINFAHPVELMDGTILLAGYTNNHLNLNDELIFMRTDANGNILWHKLFYSTFWTYGNGSADAFYLQEVKQDPYSGDIYICGAEFQAGKAVMKMSLATGNILWGNVYNHSPIGGGLDWPAGMEIRPNEIRCWARVSSSNYNNAYITVLRLNKQTGDTISTRVFDCTDAAGINADMLVPESLTILNNGHTVITGRLYGYWVFNWDGVTPLYHTSMLEFDTAMNFVRGRIFRSAIEANPYTTRVNIFPDGSGTYQFQENLGSYEGNYYISQLQNGEIIRRRKKHFTNTGYPIETRSVQLPDGGQMTVKMHSTGTTNDSRIEFVKYHSSDTASACLGYNDTLIFNQPVQYIPLHVGIGTIYRNVYQERVPKTLRLSTYNGYRSPACFQVSHCDTVWLSASPTVACPGMPVTVHIHKNNACGTEVPLQYDTAGVASVVRVNDSTYTFTFNTTWSNYIKASLQGCTLHRDSVQVNILAVPPGLNLGPDTIICPANTITLHAGPGYATYQWQDGSTDSLFTVTQPGRYYVTVTNACWGTFSDTIDVAPHPPIPFSIGPDRTKCNNDTIQLNATAGFLNYSWSPAYNISSTTTQNVVVNPTIDTVYRVSAEKTPGCFAYDTVRITVYQSPPVNLGADRGICTGDSLLLDAGPGFVQYNWNTGPTSQQLVVKTAGQYQLTATTAQGCITRDTFRLISVYALPVVALNPDTSLCIGSSRVLDAGAGYVSYAWNTGAGTRTISVNGTGIYGVNVTDPNGCKGSDTTIINKLLPLPAGFLFADTAICSFGSIELIANSTFSRYNWSTGSTSSVISITQPGTYWLDATDRTNCTGRDSVIVNPKDCLTGLYVPSGFTPNGDGKNDVLRTYLSGNIKQYEFRIFNRWGETVFVTKDPTAGWNGTWKGIVQDGNVFIWTCRYQLEGEALKTAKGTVTLIR